MYAEGSYVECILSGGWAKLNRAPSTAGVLDGALRKSHALGL